MKHLGNYIVIYGFLVHISYSSNGFNFFILNIDYFILIIMVNLQSNYVIHKGDSGPYKGDTGPYKYS